MAGMTTVLDPIILGHNPFFGVDHLSRDRIPARHAEAGDLTAVLDRICLASELGAGGLMLPSGDQANPLLDMLRSETDLKQRLNIYPQIPHAGQLGARSAERGMVRTVLDLLREAGIRGAASLATGGTTALITRDITRLLRTLINLELARFEGLHIPAVFLHPVFTDLALGLGSETIVRTYIDHMVSHTTMRPAFCTLNLPLLCARFNEWSLEMPLTMTAINAAGYRMNPSQLACEHILRHLEGPVAAMMILAGGQIPPEKAVDYVLQFDSVKSVIIGASAPIHIRQSVGLIQQRLRDR